MNNTNKLPPALWIEEEKVCAQTNTISDLNTFMWVLFYRGLYPFLFTSQNIFMDSEIAKCNDLTKQNIRNQDKTWTELASP